MSDWAGSTYRDRPAVRRAAVLLAVLLGLALVVAGGSLLRPETASPLAGSAAVVGRTSTVCTVPSSTAATPAPATPAPATPAPATPAPATPAPATPAPATPAPATPAPATPAPATPAPLPPSGSPSPGTPPPTASPSASAPQLTPTPSAAATTPGEAAAPSTVSAVTVRRETTEPGVLTGAALAATSAELELTEPGTGDSLAAVPEPVVLTGQGAMAATGSGAVSSSAGSGESAGLMAAPCLLPGTEHWFAGVGATDSDRTELIVSNPDETQAEVDLRFYGPEGRVVVPGSPGVVVGARETRTISISSLVEGSGPRPAAVAVRAGSGRVAVAARRLRTSQDRPAGADWQIPSVEPATSLVLPGVPGGAGSRELAVVNPGGQRARVTVEVLGLGGAFVPAGADVVEVAPESTATVELTAGLAGEAGSVRLRSDQPVTAAVVAGSERAGAAPDLAVQSATPPLVRQGVSALATTTGSVDSELVLSNGAEAEAGVSFEVLSYAGVSLRRDDILLGPGTSATRRLTSPGPSYVVVTVPDGSAVVGSVTLTRPEGEVAGLATIPLTSPDVASRVPQVQQDPAVAR